MIRSLRVMYNKVSINQIRYHVCKRSLISAGSRFGTHHSQQTITFTHHVLQWKLAIN